MTRERALQLSTLLVVLSGLTACLVLGGWFPAVGLGSALLVLLAEPLRRHLHALPWAPLTGVIALLGFALPWSLGASLLGMLASTLIGLQLARRWARTGPGDDRASAILALLMIVLTASVDPSLLVGGSALAWTIGVVPLGMLSHLLRDGPRARRSVGTHLFASTLVVLALGLLCFLALPRLSSADHGTGDVDAEAGRIGFRDEVSLGEVGTLLDDPTPVLRVWMPSGAPAPDRLRGIVLDHFDGRSWLATLPDVQSPESAPADARPIRVQAEPQAGAVAFAPGTIRWIDDTNAAFQPDLAGTWRLQVPPRRLSYTAWVAPPEPDTTPRGRWTRLPADLDPRITTLAEEILPGASPDARTAAEEVSDWLEREMAYTFRPRDAEQESPLSTFLFERRTGHCEYFSTAAAVLLRARDVPARVVNGYAQPEYNAAGGYWLARQGHAHSWIEVRDAEGRWHALDPTPGGARAPQVSAWMRWSDTADAFWTGRVLAYDGSTQVRSLRRAGWFVQSRVLGRTPGEATPWLGLTVLVGLGVAGMLGLVWGLRRLGQRLAGERRGAPDGPVARLHRRAWQLAERRGWTRVDGLPPVEAARRVRGEAEDIGACLEAIAWLHYRVRFAGEEPGPLVPQARAQLVRLRTLLRQTPARPRERR